MRNVYIKKLGDFRVVGVVISPNNTQCILGYLLYVEKNGTLQYMAKNIVVQLIGGYKFTNAEIDDCGNIVCKDCGIENLPKYNGDISKPIDINKIYIVGETKTNSEVIGYRVVTGTGRVMDLSRNDLLEYMKSGDNIVNTEFDNLSEDMY